MTPRRFPREAARRAPRHRPRASDSEQQESEHRSHAATIDHRLGGVFPDDRGRLLMRRRHRVRRPRSGPPAQTASRGSVISAVWPGSQVCRNSIENTTPAPRPVAASTDRPLRARSQTSAPFVKQRRNMSVRLVARYWVSDSPKGRSANRSWASWKSKGASPSIAISTISATASPTAACAIRQPQERMRECERRRHAGDLSGLERHSGEQHAAGEHDAHGECHDRDGPPGRESACRP